MNCCEEHSAHSVEIANLKRDNDKQWKVIDTMKSWVILGMGGLLVQCVFFILNLVKAQ